MSQRSQLVIADALSAGVKANLTAGISATDTSFTLESGTGFGTSDFDVVIDNEIITVGSRSGAACSSLTRGVAGTMAAPHNRGGSVAEIVNADTVSSAVEGGGSLPAEWTVGADGELTMSIPVGSGNNVAALHIVDPNNPDTSIEIRLTDDGGADETVLLSLAPSGDNEAKIQLVDDNSDGFVTLRTGDASVFQARTGTTGANPVLAVKVGGAAIFEVHADGSLHGKSGQALTFDL